MRDVIPDSAQPQSPSSAPDAPAPAGGTPTPEDSAFSRASDALQRHREPSEIWGDER